MDHPRRPSTERLRVLALVLAGGEGSRLDVLTDERAKPAVPFAGVYRLIDVPLSNCVHSGIDNVWILQQYEPHSLNDHLANGRPWDLDRTNGGLRLLPPYQGGGEAGWHEGNADAIWRHRRFVREFDPGVVVVLSSDHIYRLDYRDVIASHVSADADVTMVTTRVPIEDAGRFGTVEVDGDGRVVRFDYKPDDPQSDVVTTEVFVYRAAVLLDALDELGGDDGSSLQDFGHSLIPRMVEEGKALAFPLDGYWRDVGTVDSYWEGHMDLLSDPPKLDLDRPDWPILTQAPHRTPAWVAGSAGLDAALLSPGCEVRGRVVRSVLGPGVSVEEGAEVRESVVLHDAVIEAGASVVRSVLDARARIGREARVGDAAGDLTLVGQHGRVDAGRTIEAGGRVKATPRSVDASIHGATRGLSGRAVGAGG